jgi:hypothetical protein
MRLEFVKRNNLFINKVELLMKNLTDPVVVPRWRGSEHSPAVTFWQVDPALLQSPQRGPGDLLQ